MIMILTRNYIPGMIYIYFINREKFGNSTRSRESRAGFLKKRDLPITNYQSNTNTNQIRYVHAHTRLELLF